MDEWFVEQVEMLYQRYFLRINQSNIMHLLSLLLSTMTALLVVQGCAGLLAHHRLDPAPAPDTHPFLLVPTLTTLTQTTFVHILVHYSIINLM